MLDKIAVYTCITGNYDSLIEIEKKESNIDYYCFTNNKYVTSDTWKIIYLTDREISDHYLSRRIKMFATEELKNNYDILIYIDSNVKFTCKINDFLNQDCDLVNYDFVALKHFERSNIKDEALECISLQKDDEDLIKKQLKFYKDEKFPDNLGLCEMCVFVYKTKSKEVFNTMKLWYEMIVKYCKRDQLSFMYSAYKNNLKFQILPYDIKNEKRILRVEHEKSVMYSYYIKDKKNIYSKRYNGILNYEQNGIYSTFIIPKQCFGDIKFEIKTDRPLMLGDIKINNKSIKYKSYIEYELYNDYKIYFGNITSVVIPYKYLKGKKYSLKINFRYMTKDDYYGFINTLKSDYQNENKMLRKELDAILNSKGWKILEKLRKIKK